VKLKMTAVAAILVLLQACAAFGLPVAKSFNERLASGYATATAVRETTSAWVDSRVRVAQGDSTMTPEQRTEALAAVRKDAQNIQDQVDKAREGLDVANSLKGLDLKSAEARLASGLVILQALQIYLEGK